MTFGVLSALPDSEITVDDPACVAVSFPQFWEALREAIG
jgi:3-phosphoshikimate 1-carboxyvinyltransferase